MSRLRWPDSTNSVSEKPGTIQYRVGNWAEYDRALVRRGDVTLWLTPDAIATWAAAGGAGNSSLPISPSKPP